MAPYFSIILPIYNVRSYLKRCIHSVLDQSFRDYELILVDDGSTDGSAEICDEYAVRYPFVRTLHKQNGGLSSARNAGLAVASGEYIWWIDSDDWIEAGALEKLYQASASALPDMVKFNCFRREKEQKTLICSNAEPCTYYAGEKLEQLVDKAFFCAGKYGLSAWGHIYRRDFLEVNALTFESERVIGSEDYLFNLEALLCTKHVQVISDALYNYEHRVGSLSNSYKKDLAERYTRLYVRLREYCSNTGLLEENEKKICSFYVWHLIHGTYIPNEYHVSEQHSLDDGRKNIRVFLKTDEFQYAIRHCDDRQFSLKQKIQLLAMRQRVEGLFYYLFVIKPGKKEGDHYED